MKRFSAKIFSVALMLALLLSIVPAAQPVQALSNSVVISQVYGGGGNTYKNDFVELFNRGTEPVSLKGMSIQYASATGVGNFGANSGQLTVISGVLAPGQYYLVQLLGGTTGLALPTPDATGGINMSGTGGKVALVNSTTSLGCNGGSAPCSAAQLAQIVDLVGWDGANFFEGTTAAPATTNSTAVIRNSSGCSETDSNLADFTIGTPTPRNTLSPLSACGENAPLVMLSTPDNGAVNVNTGADIIFTFTEPVNVTEASFSIECTTSGPHPFTLSGGPRIYTLNPSNDFVISEVCKATVFADQVTDQDSNDPPDNMSVNYVAEFETEAVCGDPATLIHDIQGSGPTSPIVGSKVHIEGIVVSDLQRSDQFNGFYVQEEDADADDDSTTSEGIFIFSTLPVDVGDQVRLHGSVVEFVSTGVTLTELTDINYVKVCESGQGVTSTEVTLPFEDLTYPERYEGMLVHLPQSLVISEYFNYDRFGEIVLALPLDGETRPFTPTAIDEPGAPAQARALANTLRRLTLDDGLNVQNPAFLRHPNGDAFALTNFFRGGDTVQNVAGVFTQLFGLYRIQPSKPADYTAVNPRPAAPEPVGGNLRVSAMNTLNFFLTADYPTGNSDDNKCGPLQNVECRGWDFDQATEFTRQRDKLLAALAGLDADIIGLNELENTPGVNPLGDPTNGIVAGLNALLGAGTYAYIDTGVIGSDAIRVGMIYKPAKVTPVGAFKILDSSVDPRFIDTKSRPVLAQTFEEAGSGARFTVAVNHLKSKGSDCNDVGDPDIGDGQGNCNQTRTAAAQALVDWLATDPTGSGDADYLIIGDLNSYAKEDPIDAILAGPDDTPGTYDDYTNLIFKYQGTYAYSYVFDGQAGYLDHALASPSLAAQVTGAAEWHINADESDVLDYDTSFKPAAVDALYEPAGYRASDHDPVLVGLALTHFDWDGFFHPVDNKPTFNTIKAGSSIPVKFSLGGDQGMNIFMAGYPLSYSVPCQVSGAQDAVEQTFTAGSSSLAYDPLTGEYIYIWKTAKSWAGTCRELKIIFSDGTIRTALFTFTR